MHQMVSTIYYLFWVRYHPSKVYSQKKSRLETKYRPPFPLTTKPHRLNPLDRGPTSLVLAGYRLVMLQPLCAYSTIFCFCFLSFPRRFYCRRLVLFRSAACFVLFLHAFPATFVISFSLTLLSFTRFLLLTLLDVPCFFLLCFFISVSTPILLYQRTWAFVGQIMLIGSKGSWAQFVFVCQSHSAKELYSAADLYSATDLYSVAGPFPLHFFLWNFLALWSSWQAFGPCFSLGFPPYGFLDTDSQKWASTLILHTFPFKY